jgi:LacI family transcriptional regulator, gluconate utilization system Gnt-I transcriptional repressor
VDAVFCSSDMLALGVMFEAQAREIPIPGQLAVVGYGDLDFARDTVPSLTSVRVNGSEIGERAAKYIIDQAQGRSVAGRVADVGFSIAKRETS